MLTKIFKKLLVIPLIFLFLSTRAAGVDTVTIHSGVMKRDIKAVVITPTRYNKNYRYPVVYLLHGFSGNYADWVTKDPAVKALADQYNCMIVCPDGAFASWYIDSPINKYWMFDTYVSKELVTYVDEHFSTIRNRSGRAITGLSMGGHGAITMGINHQDVYGAMGSMSGCMDLRPYKKDFAIDQILGEYDKNPQSWLDHSATGMVGKLKPGGLKIILDCGSDDFFIAINNAFHEQLLAAKIPHDYTVRPGGHTWEYWSNSINYQFLFFFRYFNKLN